MTPNRKYVPLAERDALTVILMAHVSDNAMTLARIVGVTQTTVSLVAQASSSSLAHNTTTILIQDTTTDNKLALTVVIIW